MIVERKANDRGEVRMSWLHARHSFSFASYLDPKWMGFSKLRVINEDIIDEDMGFETHHHKNMEIITFILDGDLKHKDTMGNETKISKGEIQVMSAGSGVMHSEFNPSKDQKTHMLQIWIEPNILDTEPSYQQFKYESSLNELTVLADDLGGDKVAKINQKAKLSLGCYEKGQFEFELNSNAHYWIQILNGSININGSEYKNGDALGISEESLLTMDVFKKVDFLYFELP